MTLPSLIVIVCILLSFYFLVRFPYQENPATSLGYLIAGVFVLFASLIIGLPIIFGGV